MSASGHKFYGPKGIGFVYVKKEAQDAITPLLDGGGQEAHLRSGTLNVPGIVGLGEAIKLATTDMDEQFWHYAGLRNRLYEHIYATFPDVIVNGPDITSIDDLKAIGDLNTIAESIERLPHNLNITLPSIDPDQLGRIYTVAFSSTSACSSGEVEPSYVLMDIGRSEDEAKASLRFGIGRFNTEAEVDEAAAILAEALSA